MVFLCGLEYGIVTLGQTLEVLGTLVICGVVFGTLLCGVFDVLHKLMKTRMKHHVIASKPFIGR